MTWVYMAFLQDEDRKFIELGLTGGEPVTLSEHTSMLYDFSRLVADGSSIRNNSQHVCELVARMAADESGTLVNVYHDSLGYFCTAHDVSRDDVVHIYTAPGRPT